MMEKEAFSEKDVFEEERPPARKKSLSLDIIDLFISGFFDDEVALICFQLQPRFSYFSKFNHNHRAITKRFPDSRLARTRTLRLSN